MSDKKKNTAKSQEPETPKPLAHDVATATVLELLNQVKPPLNCAPDLFLKEHAEKLAGVSYQQMRHALIVWMKQQKAEKAKASVAAKSGGE